MTDSKIDEIRARHEQGQPVTMGDAWAMYRDVRDLLDQIAAKDAALRRLIADYEDVPDATDTDGQQVFADARTALGDKP